ncbi:glycosyltransferase [Beijerinckia sp. L45]|uniref:glycosyltransferase family 2 protein n=1 Tax=Beijerinckia sp. L45 TaxID=1641855 RepID=UPI00131E10F0|nr:glycosyltransferase [Beijerinckia sp. L45]
MVSALACCGPFKDLVLQSSGNLNAALIQASPRLRPVSTPWPSLVIHGAVVALWFLLLARSVMVDSVFAWSVGLVYIAYDTALIGFVFVQTLALLRPKSVPTGILARPTLGVLVAAHNEASVLPITLRALFAQSEAADLIVVADDGSQDETATLLAQEFGLQQPSMGAMSAPSSRHPTLRWMRLPHGGKARALNAAIAMVETELVLTVDGDTLLDPEATRAMRDAFAADPALVAATGVLTPICSGTLSGRFYQWFQTYEYIRNFLSRYAWGRMDALLLISGAFAGFRRLPVLEVGGFDPACLVEDYELIHRLRRYGVLEGLGWTTGVVGAAKAITDAPSTTAAFLRQRRRWFCGFLQTQYWYRDMVGNPRYGRLGLMMLPVKALDTLQPIYGLLAFALLVFYLVTGRLSLAAPVGVVILAKIAIDFAFHLWSIHLYRRWVDPDTSARLDRAILASLAEPFTFQILRHTGAALGWVYFLTGQSTWGKKSRLGLVDPREAMDGKA